MSPAELRAALKQLGWSQAELARRVGQTPASISKVVRGKRKKVPGALAAYVELYLRMKKLIPEL